MFITANCFAQPSITPGYSYLHSPTFDKILQTYNSSRPWQEDKLIPLTSGYSGKFGWNWRIQNTHEIHLQPEVGYMRFAASSSNSGQKINVGFNQFNISTSLRIHPKSIFKVVQGAGPLGTRFFISTAVAYSFYLPFARTNGEPLMWDEDYRYRELTSTFNFSFGAGYNLINIGRFVITPEFSMTWYPYIELADFAEAVNGHNLTRLKNEADNVFYFNAGIRITYIKSQSHWWDRPREGDKT